MKATSLSLMRVRRLAPRSKTDPMSLQMLLLDCAVGQDKGPQL